MAEDAARKKEAGAEVCCKDAARKKADAEKEKERRKAARVGRPVSEFIGVAWSARDGRWYAQIRHDGTMTTIKLRLHVLTVGVTSRTPRAQAAAGRSSPWGANRRFSHRGHANVAAAELSNGCGGQVRNAVWDASAKASYCLRR